MKRLIPILLLLLILPLAFAALPDFVSDRNITYPGANEGTKNQSFSCFKDGTCMTTAVVDTNDTARVNALVTENASLWTNASQQAAAIGLKLDATDQRYNESTKLSQINTSANILVLAHAAGLNTTAELLSYFTGLYLNSTSSLNASNLLTGTIPDARLASTVTLDTEVAGLAPNNYTIACSVSGTTTKTATCSRNGFNNFTYSWADLDTDTDTNSGGVSNVTGILTGSTYLIVSGNITHFNITLNASSVNGSWNDTPFIVSQIGSLNTTILALIAAKLSNGTDINASRLRVNSVDVCLSNGTNCPSTAVDQNNYTTSIDVTGTTTKTINLVRNGAPNVNTTFTDIDTQGNISFGNGSSTYRVDSGKTVRILPGRNVSDIQIANDTSGNLNFTINVIDTDTSNTTAQMIAATNNTLNALRVACGNITGASSNLCTLVDTDTNSGGNMSVLRIGIGTGNNSQLLNNSLLNVTCGTGLVCNLICGAGTCNMTITNTVTDTFNTSAQMISATNNTLNALRVACGNITGASSNLCTLVDTDTNSGGTLLRILSPNGSLIIVANSTDANLTINGTWLDNQVVMQTEYANLDTDSTNDLTTASILKNTTGSRINITGTYQALVATIPADNLTGADIQESSLGTVPTATSAATATALGADPANCAAGSSPAGITAGGVAEGCQDTLNTSDAAGGEISGTYGALVVGNDVLDDQYIELGDAFTNASGDINVTGPYNALVLKANCVAITGSAALCDGDDASGGASSVNGSTIWVNSPFLINTTTDALLKFNSSGFCYTMGMEDSGANFKIKDCDGAVLVTLNKDSDSVQIQNGLSTASYGGTYGHRVKAGSSQTANIFEVVTNGDALLFGVNGSGAVNSTQPLYVQNKLVCLADGTNCPASGSSGGWLNSSGGGNISLANPNVNVSINTLFIDNTNGQVIVNSTAQYSPLMIYGNNNGYAEINVWNKNGGQNSSADHVATNNVGTSTSFFVDMGINGGNYSSATWTINTANDSYLYAQNGSLAIGTSSAAKNLSLFTGGTLAANERVRISDGGVEILGGGFLKGGNRNQTMTPLYFPNLILGGGGGGAITSYNSAPRCTSFRVEQGTQAVGTNLSVWIRTTNTSIGGHIGIFNCTSADTMGCTTGSLLINTSYFAFAATGLKGNSSSTPYALSPGNYVACLRTNVSNAQSNVLQGFVNTAGQVGSMTASNEFDTTETFTLAANNLPALYLWSQTGVVN